jgi:hypothetical protein
MTSRRGKRLLDPVAAIVGREAYLQRYAAAFNKLAKRTVLVGTGMLVDPDGAGLGPVRHRILRETKCTAPDP